MLDTTPTQASVEQESEAASADERASLLWRLEQDEPALAVYAALIEPPPQDAPAFAGKGNRLLLLKHPEAALAAYMRPRPWLQRWAQPGRQSLCAQSAPA